MARVQELVTRELDWERLLRLAIFHKMVPLLNRAVGGHGVGSAAAAEGLARLRDHAGHCVARSLNLTCELLRVLAALDGVGIPAVPYKGPVLSVRLYGDLGLRQVGDLDLLIRRRDVAEARRVLEGLEYRPRHQLTKGASDFQVARGHSSDYFSPGGIPLELHWAFVNRDVHFPLTLEDLQPRLDSTDLAGRQVPIFGREDLLLTLCVHGAKHRWDRLEWLCGVGQLLREFEESDWQVVVRRAALLRCTPTLLLGAFTAHEILGAPIPDGVGKMAREHRWVPSLSSEVNMRLRTEDHRHPSPVVDLLSRNLHQLPLEQGLGNRFRYLFHRILTPHRAQAWQAVSLGGVVIPIHSITWPFRLIGRAIKRPLAWMAQRRAHRRVDPGRREEPAGASPAPPG